MLNLSLIFALDQACERHLAQLEAGILRLGLSARLDEDTKTTELRPRAGPIERSILSDQSRLRASCSSFRFVLCHQSTTQDGILSTRVDILSGPPIYLSMAVDKRQGVACKRSENPTEHAQRSWTRRKSSLPNMAMSGQPCAT